MPDNESSLRILADGGCYPYLQGNDFTLCKGGDPADWQPCCNAGGDAYSSSGGQGGMDDYNTYGGYDNDWRRDHMRKTYPHRHGPWQPKICGGTGNDQCVPPGWPATTAQQSQAVDPMPCIDNPVLGASCVASGGKAEWDSGVEARIRAEVWGWWGVLG